MGVCKYVWTRQPAIQKVENLAGACVFWPKNALAVAEYSNFWIESCLVLNRKCYNKPRRWFG